MTRPFVTGGTVPVGNHPGREPLDQDPAIGAMTRWEHRYRSPAVTIDADRSEVDALAEVPGRDDFGGDPPAVNDAPAEEMGNATMSTTGTHQVIQEADRSFETNFDRQDAEGTAALYTEDGELLPPGSDAVTGRDDSATSWQGVFDAGVATARLETVEVDGLGNTAIEFGRLTLGDGDGNTVDEGSFVVVWKDDDGEGRLHRDIWNSSVRGEG